MWGLRTIGQMRKKLLFSALLLLTLSAFQSLKGQDFSNKGKEFWLAYSYHVGMSGGSPPEMTLYITSDQSTTYTVEIFGVTNISTGTINAGQVVSVVIPTAYFINDNGKFTGRAIRVTAARPVVVYSYITRSQASGATVCLPVTVLGKDYYSTNYTQVSNEPNSNSFITIVAIEDNTTVEITPTEATKGGWAANSVNTVTLNKGEIFQVLGTTSGNNGSDLTGTRVRSISASGSCEKIAVFSGSGKISIGCSGAGSSDNLYQQLYPTASWGKKYLTVPSYNRNTNYYRIIRNDPSANVYLNGTLIPAAAFTNNYYQFLNTTPNLIESDLPISVAQYFTTQGCPAGNPRPYDPDMITLNPVEQNINQVTLVSSNLYAPQGNAAHQHHLQVIMRNGGTGLSSLRLDGVIQPIAGWTTHPSDPSYSYTYLSNVAQGYHTLSSDSGFNALAYGYGDAETYGYSAGANVKDLYQFVTVQNQFATVNFPTACKGSPFYLYQTYPYQPNQIIFDFNGLFPTVTLNGPITADSTWIVNGRTLYRYKLPTPYTINTSGTYPIKVTAINPTPDGCSGVQEIDYDIQVFDPPVADFNFTSNGCVTDTVFFTDNTNTGSRAQIKWHWNFGDASIDSVRDTKHKYAAPGSYQVKHSIITDVGCVSDTAVKTINISAQPVAGFTATGTFCRNNTLSFNNTSTIAGGGSITKWTWNFGDGSPVSIVNTGTAQTHVFANPGTYTVRLTVESSTGCISNEFSIPVTIHPDPVADFTVPNVCLPVGQANFTSTSTIPDGTQAAFTYAWEFGDGGTAGNTPTPTHNYSATGPFNVQLIVTSNNGCKDTTVKPINTIYARPAANFSQDSLESCLGGTVNFTDLSTAPSSSVNQWFWNFGDATTSIQQNPNKQYAAAGTYNVSLYINSAIGCRSDTITKAITVLSLPTVGFTNSNPLCETQNLQLTSTALANAGTFVQHNWSINGTPTGGNNSTISYVPAAAGTYTILHSVLTDKGCAAQTTNAITVNPKPLANFTLPNVCLPVGLANFTSTSTISDGSQALFTYAWNFGDAATGGNAAAVTHNYSTTGPYNVTLTVTSNNGCVDDTVKVLNTIYAQPLAAFTAPAEVCFGTPVNFTDQSTAAASSITEWTWDFGDATTSTLQNPVKNYSAPGTYTVTLTAKSAIGCVSTIATRTVVVNPLPSAAFTTSSPLCELGDITFSSTSVPNAGNLNKWTWNFGDGSPASILNTGSPFIHNFAVAGTYTVTLQVETDKGCVSTLLTRDIVINNKPEAGFISPETCLNDPFAPFTDSSKVVNGTIAAWSWNFGDPNANVANPNTSIVQNPVHRYTATGPYTAQLIVTSDKGCRDTVSQSFFINGTVPQAAVSIQNINALCSNRDVVVQNGSFVDIGNIVKVEVFWDYANDPTNRMVDDDPQPGETYNYAYPEFGTPATRNYTVRVIAYSGATCFNTIDRVITLYASPTVQFNQMADVCEEVPSFVVNAANEIFGLPGTGTYSGPGITAAGLFDPELAGPGTHTIRYDFTGTNGCTTFKTQTIRVFATPTADAGIDKTVLEGGVVTLDGNGSGDQPISYLWTPSLGLDDATIAKPKASPPDDQFYTLLVTSANGCKATDVVFVKLLKKPDIPNIFSPNGDGVHDRWVINHLESYPGAVVEVYNRYGQLVFRTVNYTTPWDGTYNGKPLPIGTYYYIVDPKNGRKQLSGYVDIIR